MAQILLRCSDEYHQRIKAKAKALRMSVNHFLLERSLEDDRTRNSLDSAQLANLCHQLMLLQQALKEAPTSQLLDQAIETCREVGKQITLHRLHQRQGNGAD